MKSASKPSLAPGVDFTPAELFNITTSAQLKAISDPLRVSILEFLVEETLTVKQVARRLDQPPTRLYYHFAALEESGFITVVDTRVKSGIIEKYYRAAYKNYQVDRKLLNSSPGQNSPFQNILSLVFDSTVSDLMRSFSAGLVNPLDEGENHLNKLIISRTLFDLRPEDVAVFIDRFKALLDEMNADRDKTGTQSYACTVAFYPRVRDEKEPQGGLK